MKANLRPCEFDPAGVVGSVELIVLADVDPNALTLDDEDNRILHRLLDKLFTQEHRSWQSKQIVVRTETD